MRRRWIGFGTVVALLALAACGSEKPPRDTPAYHATASSAPDKAAKTAAARPLVTVSDAANGVEAFILLAQLVTPAFGKGAPLPGIDKPTKVIAADFARRFPCIDAGLPDWGTRPYKGCVGNAQIEPYRSNDPASEITLMIAIFDLADDRKTRIRREVSPIYGQTMRYLFPHWPQASAWLYRSLENTRQRGCPSIAHIRDIWMIVRPSYGARGGHDYADVIITRSSGTLNDYRKLDEPMCDRLPFVEEIKLAGAKARRKPR